MTVILGTVLCAVSRIFLEPMMVAFGATDKVLEYALTYTGITSLGFPFPTLTTGGDGAVMELPFFHGLYADRRGDQYDFGSDSDF